MKHIRIGVICCTLTLLTACASTDGTRYTPVKTVKSTPACHISSKWCVDNYAYRPTPPIHSVDNELLLVYGTKMNELTVQRLLETHKLRPKNRASLGSIGSNLITAGIGNRSPSALTKTINKAQKNIRAQPNNKFSLATATLATTKYPFSLTGIEAAYPYTKGRRVKICMVDTYVDILHESLVGKAITAPRPPSSKASKHGTEIAGTILSNDPTIGIAPEVSLYVAPAFGTPEKRGTAADVAKAIEECLTINDRAKTLEEKVAILNLSLAGTTDDPLVRTMINKALEKNIIVVAAAGNDGLNEKDTYPAAYSKVIAVTAIDNKEQIYPKANRGNYIALAAPGVGIFTTAPRNAYTVATGTSIATAHVSGLIALLLSMQREGRIQKNLSPEVLTKILLDNATDLGDKGKDKDYGYGLVNLNNALQKLK